MDSKARHLHPTFDFCRNFVCDWHWHPYCSEEAGSPQVLLSYPLFQKNLTAQKRWEFSQAYKMNICAFIYNKHEAIQKRKFHGARRSCFEDFPYPYFSTLTQNFFPKVTFQFQKLVWIKSKLLRRHFVDRTSKGKWQTLHNKFDKNIIVIIIIKNTKGPVADFA